VMKEQQRLATRLTMTHRERKDGDGGRQLHGIGHQRRPQALCLRTHVQVETGLRRHPLGIVDHIG
jgi:hypothetical protein